MHVHHDWHLVHTDFGYRWLCKNCGTKVQPSEAQKDYRVFRSPNPRKKINGKSCGQLLVEKVHKD